jgi:hypothetical protein
MTKWIVLIPEFIALVSFFLKRLFPEERLVKSMVAESIKRLAPRGIDTKISDGLEMQLTDSFELDILRRDVQSASLAAFSGCVILWSSHTSDELSFFIMLAWLGLFLFVSRIGGILESGRSFRRLRGLYFASFLTCVGFSAIIKVARIL